MAVSRGIGRPLNETVNAANDFYWHMHDAMEKLAQPAMSEYDEKWSAYFPNAKHIVDKRRQLWASNWKAMDMWWRIAKERHTIEERVLKVGNRVAFRLNNEKLIECCYKGTILLSL